MPRDVILLHNPNAGSALSLAELDRLANSIARGQEVNMTVISEATEARALDKLTSELGQNRLIYVIGGDGTIGVVADLLIRTDRGGVIAPLPTGTGNDLCSHLGLSANPFEAADQLERGVIQSVDVGHATWTGDGAQHSRAFINSWGIGYDAEAARRSGRYKSLGTAAYAIAAAEVLLTWKHIHGNLRIDGSAIPASGYMFVSVCNGSSSGGGFSLAPEASLSDGVLNYFAVEKMSRSKAAALLPKVRLTGRTSSSKIVRGEMRELMLESGTEQPMHFDGEVPDQKTRSVTVRCLPAAVSLLVPET